MPEYGSGGFLGWDLTAGFLLLEFQFSRWNGIITGFGFGVSVGEEEASTNNRITRPAKQMQGAGVCCSMAGEGEGSLRLVMPKLMACPSRACPKSMARLNVSNP